MSTPGGTGVIAGRRKLLVQDGHFTVCVPKIGHGFRRTLVGLKLDAVEVVDTLSDEFQTYPCGVEAPRGGPLRIAYGSFRRTLVGLKHAPTFTRPPSRARFRRTLVGLKQQISMLAAQADEVSDVPLWG